MLYYFQTQCHISIDKLRKLKGQLKWRTLHVRYFTETHFLAKMCQLIILFFLIWFQTPKWKKNWLINLYLPGFARTIPLIQYERASVQCVDIRGGELWLTLYSPTCLVGAPVIIWKNSDVETLFCSTPIIPPSANGQQKIGIQCMW